MASKEVIDSKRDFKDMLKQYELFEKQVQNEKIPRWIKARINGLNKQLKFFI